MNIKLPPWEVAHNLSIGEIDASDIGNYTWVVSNLFGEDKSTVQVVLEANRSEDPPILYPLMVPSNPSIGDNAEMLCSLKRGSLPITFKWLYNNQDMTLTSKYKISSTDKSSHFSIGNIQPNDIGNYTCVATNNAGVDRKVASIIMEASEEISESPVLYPLMVPSNPTLGDDTDILCKLRRGSKPVKFEWFHDGNSIDIGNKRKITTTDRRVVKMKRQFLHPLSIPPDLNIGDSLDIQCSLKRGSLPVTFEWKVNGVTPLKRIGVQINTFHKRSVYVIDKFQLQMLEIILVSHQIQTSYLHSSVHFVTSPKIVLCIGIPILHPFIMPPDLGLGDSLDIQCSLKRGNLPVTFEWKLNGKEIKGSPGIRINTSERRSVCVIQNINHEHIGNYTCRASNNEGYDEVHTELKVEVPPHWTKEPMDTTAAKGSGLVVDCAATGHPVPRVSWNRQKGTDLRETIRNEGQWTTASNGSLVFSRIDESDAGVYICEAHNGIGPGISKSIQISVHTPPELKKKFERVTVRRGHTARLMCEISGDQPLYVSWKKDNQDVNIQFGTRFEVVKDATDYGTKSELLIHDSQKADVGSYVCQARNKFGEDEGKVKLIVLEPPSPPTGIRTSEVQTKSIRLSWQPSSSDEGLVENYVVRYWRNDEKRGKLHQVTLPAVQTSVTIPNLHPGTSYSVQVFAQNNVGQGDPSQPITFRTVEAVPDGAPLDLRVEPVSSKAIRVSWKPPQRHHWNGPLRGYYVGNKVAHSSSPFTFQTVETTDRRGGSLLIQGLLKATTYTIIVKAFNAAGSGPATHEVQVTTLEEDPPSPPIVGVADVTASSVGIHWNIGSDKQPSVVQYLLEFREEGEEWDHIHLPGERTSFYLTGLKGSTRYELRLAAYNVFGRGEFSPTIDFTTGLAEISVPFSITHSNIPFYFRPYFVIPVAASVVVIVTTVVIAWVCYKRMTLRQDRLLAACQPLDCRLMQARVPLQRGDTGFCDSAARPPSYTPPMGARHPVGVPDDDDAYDAPWDMANPGGQPGNAQAGSYTRLKSQMPNPGGAIVIGHQSGSSR
ncbi:Down syndrome cell adhesion molecule like protein [Argiope bruennichi]|uniref:Down syndrome cell adhesion molecule like protein n=1 Tax=Argiope bruennichi TaxID=94029 RepID=A0A8T0E084_ARGBR|nr:Down syndrome cell adhesion molecule like protein [Argiope bruennichi]